jgi:uncharacterized membrane protein YhaH (DUF805 family)
MPKREPLWQPLLRYADFSGRSRRTELIGFWLLLMFGGAALQLGASFLDFELENRIRPILAILSAAVFLCPWLALSARRLHDSGRSGWWVFLSLPTLTLSLWENLVRLQDPFALPGGQPVPLPVTLMMMLALLAFMALLFWDDDPDTNRYGPNPRRREVGEAH